MINSFPGYECVPVQKGNTIEYQNIYKGINVGRGGYVYSDPGMYADVTVIDVSSMHPSSILAMNYFGEYTRNYRELMEARIAIKHKEFDKARKMFGGKLSRYLDDESQAKMLAQAIKIALNSTYGITAAEYSNPLKHSMNKNNIVALRGALFMVNLKEEVEKRGFKVISIKTDSMKIVHATPELISFAMEYGKKYGYNFEIENHFEKICLVNDAVFIAKCADDDPDEPGQWKAVGTQFAVPYVFKTLFSKEPIIFEDLCETKSVKSAIYLDMNEDLADNQHDLHFIGKVGLFTPIKPGCGGGILVKDNEGKYDAVVGTKGYRWLESEVVKELHKEDDIDLSYYNRLVDEAIESISAFGDIEWFIDDFLSEDFLKVPEGAPEPGVPF